MKFLLAGVVEREGDAPDFFDTEQPEIFVDDDGNFRYRQYLPDEYGY